MNRDETKQIIGVMIASYPNYKPADLAITVNLWTEMFKDYTFGQVAIALKAYIATDTSGFAPSIGQLIGKMQTLQSSNDLNEMQAWALVSNALRDAIYHSQERFDAFPEVVQKAVGSPEVLRAWALDNNYNENVAQSHFISCYRQALKRDKEVQALPTEIRQLITTTQFKEIGTNDI